MRYPIDVKDLCEALGTDAAEALNIFWGLKVPTPEQVEAIKKLEEENNVEDVVL